MRYVSLFICVLALCGCKSAEQQAADNAAFRARIVATGKETCRSFGYSEGSAEHARCVEGLFRKAIDTDVAAAQIGGNIAAAQARNRVSCTGYGNTVNCY